MRRQSSSAESSATAGGLACNDAIDSTAPVFFAAGCLKRAAVPRRTCAGASLLPCFRERGKAGRPRLAWTEGGGIGPGEGIGLRAGDRRMDLFGGRRATWLLAAALVAPFLVLGFYVTPQGDDF